MATSIGKFLSRTQTKQDKAADVRKQKAEARRADAKGDLKQAAGHGSEARQDVQDIFAGAVGGLMSAVEAVRDTDRAFNKTAWAVGDLVTDVTHATAGGAAEILEDARSDGWENGVYFNEEVASVLERFVKRYF